MEPKGWEVEGRNLDRSWIKLMEVKIMDRLSREACGGAHQGGGVDAAA